MQKHLLVIVATSAISQALAQSVIGTLTGKKIGVLHASALGTDADEATVFTGTKDDLAEALARCGKDITVLDGGSAPSSGMPLSESHVTLAEVNDNVLRVLTLVTPQDKQLAKLTQPRTRTQPPKTADDGKKKGGGAQLVPTPPPGESEEKAPVQTDAPGDDKSPPADESADESAGEEQQEQQEAKPAAE
jgi:hypothetical protein